MECGVVSFMGTGLRLSLCIAKAAAKMYTPQREYGCKAVSARFDAVSDALARFCCSRMHTAFPDALTNILRKGRGDLTAAFVSLEATEYYPIHLIGVWVWVSQRLDESAGFRFEKRVETLHNWRMDYLQHHCRIWRRSSTRAL